MTMDDGTTQVFDHVIMACHSDVTLKLLGEEATQEEIGILSSFRWSKNKVVMHSDTKVK